MRSKPDLRRVRDKDDLLALIGDARQVVELRDRVVERLRAEHDGERILVSLLVQAAKIVARVAPAT